MGFCTLRLNQFTGDEIVNCGKPRSNGMTYSAALHRSQSVGCKALGRAELSADAIDVVEINEAFATQSIASVRDLGLNIDKVNIDGGAIAIGHPLGATGARITGKAAQILKREGGRYALSTQCIGGGQGIATVMETVGV